MKQVVFDCDDVLARCRYALEETIQEHLNETQENPPHVKWQEWTDFYGLGTQYGITFDDVLDLMIKRHDLEFMQPEPTAPAVTNALKDAGYHIKLLTARGYHPNAQFITERWLKVHNIHVDDIIIVGSRESKRDVLATMGQVEFYVEDNHHHAEQAEGLDNVKKVYLLNRPWNADIHSGTRVDNLYDVLTNEAPHLLEQLNAHN